MSPMGLLKTTADVESAIRDVMGAAIRDVNAEVVSIENGIAAVRVRFAAPDDIDIDALLDKAIEAVQAAESEIEQFRPRRVAVQQAMEEALDEGEYRARSLVIRPALAGGVDACIESTRREQSARVRLTDPPRLSELRAQRNCLADYRTTIAEKRGHVQHYEDGARRACLALVSGGASDGPQVTAEAGR